MVRVKTGGRIHFGFANLSLSHERLYGALGVALERPQTTIEATATEVIRVDTGSDVPDRIEQDTRQYVRQVCDLLDVPWRDSPRDGESPPPHWIG
jgi:Predicted archaeal sugar kinases